MAFDFLGTYTEDEITALLVFAETQLQDVDGRLAHLRANVERVGYISMVRNDENNVIDYFISPSGSLLDKYVKAYRFYGGDITKIPVRSRGQWLFFTKGEPDLNQSAEFQGGKVEGAEYDINLHYDDGIEAITTSKVKDWCIPTIQAKREDWEYRIRKAVDLCDQYMEEIILLLKRSTGTETLSDLRIQVNHYLSSPEFVGAGKKRMTRDVNNG